jgi:hypothetical protein
VNYKFHALSSNYFKETREQMSVSMRKSLFLVCIVPSLVIHGLAQTNFDSLSAWRINNELASERFEGRKSGTQGGERTADWISSKFKEWGVEPGGANGTYFAPFHLLVTEDMPATKLELINGRKGRTVYSLGDDYTLLTNSGTGNATSELVFVGYGISEPSKGRNDYASVDVKGKIVMVLAGGPPTGNWSEESSRGYKIKNAGEKGAAGVLFVSGDHAVRGGAVQERYYEPELPSVWVGSKIVFDVFYDTGLDYSAIRSQLDRTPKSFSTGKTFHIEANVVRQSGISKNVVGLIRGTDPKLKDTYVVVGAHMDHNGKDSEGSIYPGADDNASGTAAVMELARSMKANHVKPKRSILFIGFAGEEQGLLGSKAFVDSPTVVRDRMVFMLNLDMVGRGNGDISVGGMENYPYEWRMIEQQIPDTLRTRMGKFRVGENSDHYPFADKGIPAFFLVTSGSHPEYHQTSDSRNKIQPFVLGAAGSVAYDIVLYVANCESSFNDNDRYYRYLYHRSDVVVLDDYTNADAASDTEIVLHAKQILQEGAELALLPLIGTKTDGLESLMTEYARLARVIERNASFLGFAKSATDVSSINSSQKLAIACCLTDVGKFIQHPSLLFAFERLGIRFISASDEDLASLFDSDVLNDSGKRFIEYLNESNLVVILNSTNSHLVVNFLQALKKPAIVSIGIKNELSVVYAYADSLTAKKGVFVLDCGPEKLSDSEVGKIQALAKKFTVNNIMLKLGTESQISQVGQALQVIGMMAEETRKVFGANVIGLLN